MTLTVKRALARTSYAVLAGLFVATLAALVRSMGVAGQPPWAIVLNSLIVLIPVGTIFFALALLVTVAAQESIDGHMTGMVRGMLRWAPRVIGLVFAGFFSLFALDVFGAGYGFWQSVLAFVIHAGPALLALVAVAFAWRRPRLGMGFFGLLGVLLLLRFAIGMRADWSVYLMIAAPPLLVSALYAASWLLHDELAPAPPADIPT